MVPASADGTGEDHQTIVYNLETIIANGDERVDPERRQLDYYLGRIISNKQNPYSLPETNVFMVRGKTSCHVPQ